MSKSLKELVLEKVKERSSGYSLSRSSSSMIQQSFCDGADNENKRLIPHITQLTDLLEQCEGVLQNLGIYADAIQDKHVSECLHGNGYSLLGQLAQQVSTDSHTTLKELQSYKAELAGEGKVE